ncbi:hypothetical protein [Allonocardiopsis opalescens]|uniref:Uncharacterized protein n=1 Tax=Allonocardiopsis opalescens TaxID=1144618 RepID=A0A2T0PSV9_9ACTN|nr:hypothetical protein [Allonocardiopsis opalescens]PRX91980.1 hypothetical protein CLV72_11253 [Allonocardiopsis opalescens]
MYRYTNRNTNQVVEFPQANARLDRLSNWERTGSAEPKRAAKQEEPSRDTAQDSGPKRPSTGDPKDAWVEYAITTGMPEAEARDKDTTKAQLIERTAQVNADPEK